MPRLKPLEDIPETLLENSWSLWKALVKYGDVEKRERDSEFVPTIRTYLKLPEGGPLERQLRANSVSTERMLDAVLKVAAPYGEMLRDLLDLFERAAASSGDNNLSVRFNFNNHLEPLTIDLSAFRKLRAVWQNVTEGRLEIAWNHDTIRGVDHLLQGFEGSFGGISPPVDVKRWLEAYEKGRRWPDSEPAAIPFASSRLDTYGHELWLLWSAIVSASQRIGASRTALSAVRFDGAVSDNLEDVVGQKGSNPLSDAWLLRNLDVEGWSGNFIRRLSILAQISPVPEAIGRDLASYVDDLPRRELSVARKVRMLVDILNLPIWRRRNELYSAWVGSRIVAGLGADTVVHSSGGKLLFSFSGYHLATSHGFGRKSVHVWGELRTQFSAPKGKGRKKAIQPDFSLTLEPITSPESSVLVVEVKHYLLPARRSFADALEDYAKGRCSAQVALVDYGPIGSGVTEKLDKAVRDRCQCIEEFRPKNAEALEQFATLVRNVVDASPGEFGPQLLAGSVGGSNPQVSDPAGGSSPAAEEKGNQIGTIRLHWSTGPADLDLHIWLAHQGSTLAHVSYQDKEAMDGSLAVKLQDDCMSAPGKEIVQFGFVPQYVRCAVHNYSGQPSICSAGARVVSEIGGLLTECVAPERGEGQWWLVFDYWPRLGELMVWNSLLPTIPTPTTEAAVRDKKGGTN